MENNKKIIYLNTVEPEGTVERPPLREVKHRGAERRQQPFSRISKAEMALLGLTSDRRKNIRRQDDRKLYARYQEAQYKSMRCELVTMSGIFICMATLTIVLMFAA